MIRGIADKSICQLKCSECPVKVVLSPLFFVAVAAALVGCPGTKPGSNRTAGNSTPQNRQAEERTERGHPAFHERVEERAAMVRSQIELRQVSDPDILRAMQTVPRHAFVSAEQRPYAYEDRPLPIGQGQTISQPYIVAFMTEALKLTPESVVLEIGTGSGYQAAVAAEIAKEVYSIEIVEPLARSAAKLLGDLGYTNVHVKAGDGYYGWPEKGPFDAIIGTAAAERIPPPLIEQLKNGGRMILPVEGELGFQYLILLTKDEQGGLHREELMPVSFVPMTGDVERSKKGNN
jgi:protein-L-isoaspartate(D-aspartate) O-methyltransferase